MGNSRVSYTEGSNGNAQVVEENSYYAFGLQHKGYGPAASGLGNAHAEKYKYNGKEYQDKLGLNLYDYGARNYDPALGRWMNVDPLAEVSRRLSPYSYCYNNPLYFIDPDGMRAADSNIFNQIDSFENDGQEDWIKRTGTDGKQHITYDPKIKTVAEAEAEAKGYSNVKEVFSSGRGSTDNTSEIFEFKENGDFVINGVVIKDDKNRLPYTTEGGNIIDRNKSGVEQITAITGAAGDAISVIGLTTGQPEIVAVGETISNVTLGIEVMDNFITNGVNSETLTNNATKVGLNIMFGEVAKAGVKATRTVAGQEAVARGENIVSESILKSASMGANKLAENAVDDIKKRN